MENFLLIEFTIMQFSPIERKDAIKAGKFLIVLIIAYAVISLSMQYSGAVAGMERVTEGMGRVVSTVNRQVSDRQTPRSAPLSGTTVQ